VSGQWITASCLAQFIYCESAVEGLVPIVELVTPLVGEVGHFAAMLPNHIAHKDLKILVKLYIQRRIVAEFREFPIDCSDDFDVVVLDEIEVLLFVLFGVGGN
jgi:hypothetical protein